MHYQWLTRKGKRDYQDDVSKTHHLGDVQSFFNAGDEDADHDVDEADYSHNSWTAAQSLTYID